MEILLIKRNTVNVFSWNTVDGKILHPLRLVVFPVLYKVLHIPGGAGFLPSTVLFAHINTPPKFKMEPEDHGFQKDFPTFQGLIFRWTMLNFRGVYIFEILLYVYFYNDASPLKHYSSCQLFFLFPKRRLRMFMSVSMFLSELFFSWCTNRFIRTATSLKLVAMGLPYRGIWRLQHRFLVFLRVLWGVRGWRNLDRFLLYLPVPNLD